MNNKTIFRLSALAAAVLSSSVYSAGFQLSEHSAAGVGRANAGEAAIADSAAIIAHNAAGMSHLENTSMTLSASYIAPEVWVNGNSGVGTLDNQLAHDDVVPNVFVPSIYLVHPLNETIHVGLGIFSDFGLKTQFPDDYLAGPIGGQTELTTYNINPNISYQVTPEVSIGGGISAVYGTAKFKRTYGVLGISTGTQTNTLAMLEGTGWGLGWNLGALWKINAKHRLGISYRSNVDVDFKGDYHSDLPTNSTVAAGTNGAKIDGELTLNLPSILELSGYHRLHEKLALHYSYVNTGWSVFEEILATSDAINPSTGQAYGTVLQKDEKFSNAYKVSLGATIYATPDLELRTGIAYDQTPSRTHQSISIPDNDRMNYSVGASYRFNSNHQIDFGLTYIVGEEGAFTEEVGSGTSFDFKSKGNALVTSLQYNYTF
ncbi:outer membrane protein transport protein [Vibrio sp. SCSIO 43136]|uniref:outer membrane protein transport protein n=1 Tax=Vibrio sp. SCSIO 43136 TaxID=2819101 RepID=UPI002074FB96|nr:outer membrane protein transport protein [Vibrio sp. SCSIO 43136]USD66068.1 outer membrane protein transport protein [Vibrio sp. SCSIO 43136]